MDCLLPLIAGLCLADPSTLSLKAETNYLVDRHDFYTMNGRAYTGALGRVELSLATESFHGFRLTYFAGHQSYLNTNRDRGYEYVGAGIEWRPFR